MAETRDPPHLLVFPLPAQGHMIPLLDLAHQLSARGLTITILLTPKSLPLIQPLLARAPSIRTLVLPFPPYPSLPPGVEHVRDLPPSASIAHLIHALSALRPDIARWARSHSSPPAAILYDFFLGWTYQLAAELGVPGLAFYSSGAFLASVMDHLWLSMPRPEGPDSSLVPLPGLQGSPSFRYAHLPSLFRRYNARAGAPEWEFVKDSMRANAASWGAVLNTFHALEGPYLSQLNNKYAHGRVWAVGPIVPVLSMEGRGGRSSVPAGELAAWLDARPPRSVVYVCFGSQFSFPRAQGRALAKALEISGARFLWCVGDGRVADGAGPLVPEGFEARTEGRGLVVRGWVPQVMILSHPAVGSFLTHCGWNSVLEGIAAGVALLAWPMEADQFVNARLLVEDAGIAVLACAGGPEAVPDSAALGRLLAESVAEGTLPETRARAAEMAMKAWDAVGEDGSSFKDLLALVKALGPVRFHCGSGGAAEVGGPSPPLLFACGGGHFPRK